MIQAVLLSLAAQAMILPYAPDDKGTPTEARQVLGDFMRCVVKKHPTDASAVVLSNDFDDSIVRSPKLLTPDCLAAGRLKIPDDEFVRYGLAEALIRREYAQGVPTDIKQAAPLAHPLIDGARIGPELPARLSRKERAALEQRQVAAANAARVMSQYGECVARWDPQGALRLVLTEPSSAPESAAFGALMAPLSNCLPAETTLKVDKAQLRGSIALNLYRLAKGPRVPSPAQPQAGK
ncbi:MAG TPA: hypothetical protein VGF26_15870 [Ramlibacter sp.]